MKRRRTVRVGDKIGTGGNEESLLSFRTWCARGASIQWSEPGGPQAACLQPNPDGILALYYLLSAEHLTGAWLLEQVECAAGGDFYTTLVVEWPVAEVE